MKNLSTINEEKDITTKEYLDTQLEKKQDTLVSGSNIKTIEGYSLVGYGNIKLNIPTNNNQLTNGAGYIKGITSKNVIDALGYTPYNSETNSQKYAKITIERW